MVKVTIAAAVLAAAGAVPNGCAQHSIGDDAPPSVDVDGYRSAPGSYESNTGMVVESSAMSRHSGTEEFYVICVPDGEDPDNASFYREVRVAEAVAYDFTEGQQCPAGVTREEF